jgi:hypothetical protein
MQQLSGSSGRGGTFIPSTIRIFSGGGGGRAAGPANRDPKIIPPGGSGGVGDLPAPVVRLDSSSIRDAIAACSCSSASCSFASASSVENGLSVGFDATGC